METRLSSVYFAQYGATLNSASMVTFVIASDAARLKASAISAATA
jgi:hypothetical protein